VSAIQKFEMIAEVHFFEFLQDGYETLLKVPG